MQASAIGGCGEILVLDMGEPVKIVDLAKDLIELAGMREPEDIKIEFIGIRPGEKLHEKLNSGGEELVKGKHEKVMLAIGAPVDIDELVANIFGLEKAAMAGDDGQVSHLLAELTATAIPSPLPSEAGA
jgi:FlaA1/EpsC-like NDP-sugar epimerase